MSSLYRETVSEKEIACWLLCAFSDLLSTGAGDVGSKEQVKNEIVTGDAKPIIQHPSRRSLSKRKQAEEVLKEMELIDSARDFHTHTYLHIHMHRHTHTHNFVFLTLCL